MKNIKTNILLFILSYLLPYNAAHSLIKFEDAVFPELAVSGRALAMGNAFIAKADDSSAVFYNPAGLGTVRFPHLHLSNIHMETNKGWLDTGAGREWTDVPSDLQKSFTIEGNRKLLLENRGKIIHSRFHILPNFTTRYFSTGFLFSKRMRSTISEEDTALFEYADRLDYGPYVALNVSLGGGIFKVGVSGILLTREEVINESDRNVEVDLGSSDYKKGTALVTTTGAKLTLPIMFLPTLAVTMHNTAGQKFSSSGAGAPEKIKQSVDLGFSLTPQIGKSTRVHLEANWKDISGQFDDVSTARKILLGIELDFARIMFFRFGYGDGFGSAGIGVKSRKVELDLTTYAVDTTSSKFRGKEDRRFSLTLSSGF